MRSIDEVRAAKLAELHSIVARPGMWAAGDGRALQTVAMGALQDLCFIDDRDDDYTRSRQGLKQYGKLGVAGAFRAAFGDECNYVPEVASVFAQLAIQLGYLQVETRRSERDWQAFHAEALAVYEDRDVRRSEIEAALGPASLTIDRRVLCYAGPAAGDWVAFDCWEPPVRTYVVERGQFRTAASGDPLVRDIRVPADSFGESLILPPLGKVLRWGAGWWLHPNAGREAAAPVGVVEELRAINEADPSQALGPRRPWI